MSHIARILSNEDFAHVRRAWIGIGVLIGIAACTLAAVANAALRPRPAMTGTPVVERSTLAETVVRIPMNEGGRNFECVLRISYASHLWTLNCGR